MDFDKMFNTLWYEKYRPKTLDEMVMNEDLRQTIKDFGEDGSIPHLLFIGTAGIGKTSLAKVLVNEILGCEYLALNASVEGGINTIRTSVKDFATSASLDGGIKVVIMGEADGMSKEAQDSLKEVIEDCASSTRFIFTANDVSKLSKPIVSRCQRYDIKYNQRDFIQACANILHKENISYKDNAKSLQKLLLSCYPDFRLAIGEMQKNSKDGVFHEPVTEVENEFVKEVWSTLKSDTPEKVRALCISKICEFTSHAQLMVDMIKYAYTNFEVTKMRKLALKINEYLVNDNAHINNELNFYCCLVAIKPILVEGEGK